MSGSRSGGAGERIPPAALSRSLELDALRSRVARDALHPDERVEEWVRERRARPSMRSDLIPLERLRGWLRDPASGNLVHESGRFFSVIGLKVRARTDHRELCWDQPILEQPEVGILGIAARRFRGVLHLCLQAKEEPGNIGGVQLAPTVQATYSNYTRAHGGAAPAYLERFLAVPPAGLVFSRLQTEDGSRFLYKSNRNMIVIPRPPLPAALPPSYLWVTLRQVARLLRRDNLVNACARSVLSSLVFPGAGAPEDAQRLLASARRGTLDAEDVAHVERWLPRGSGRGETPLAETLQWLDDQRARTHVVAKREPLAGLQEWSLDAKGFFSHREGRFFRVVGLQVASPTREVGRWSQPIIENAGQGILGLLVRGGRGGPEILMQARPEAGNRGTVQLGPTVQFTPGNYHGSRKLARPFLFEEFSGTPRFPVLRESRQAEEGARFYREWHLHRVLRLPAGTALMPPPAFRWLPLSHVRFLLHLGEQVNSCARSVLACLL